jgi:hypothetical protein
MLTQARFTPAWVLLSRGAGKSPLKTAPLTDKYVTISQLHICKFTVYSRKEVMLVNLRLGLFVTVAINRWTLKEINRDRVVTRALWT